MARQAGRRPQPQSDELVWMLFGGALGFVLVLVGAWWAGGLSSELVREAAGSSNPVTIILGQFSGRVPVTTGQVVVFLLIVLVFAAIAALLVWAAWKQAGGRPRVDDRAKSMAHVKDMDELTAKRQAADAERLGASGASEGVPLAKLVNNRKRLFASWEWVQLWIMGPRAGKTSCVCVPQILETKGPVVATSNKRDIVDLTRGPRSREGVVWVHDVQGIIGEPPSWYWNPLSFVDGMENAEKLTDVFVSAMTNANAREDAYFGPTAKGVLARYILAAALGQRPITDVYRWVNDETDFTAVRLLRDAGEFGHAENLEGNQKVTSKQRDGIFGQVRTWVGILGNPKVASWVRPDANPNRPQFDPEAFVKSSDTIYLISREGGGSARAITAALVMAILHTAERVASRQARGRLSTPLMAVLDEAANVVRWPELPDLYSHYGSRGIVVSTFFQSFEQGVEAFGEHGMKKMWSAANIRVAGSGLSEDRFLPFLSSLIGDRDVVKRTSQTQGGGGMGGRSSSTSVQRERIMEPADLAQLPRGRAVMTASGQPAALLELEHFSQKDYADDVTGSQEFYESQIGKEDEHVR